ncbi:class I adenylate-forming enzyme family protein [Streptomyces sp. NPDC056670]|uniref:class I adenylate-forming enzyme family protein n=1 Tax=Streptomyces sp. NPDC056670 TaxID=3345904 RepID=UPI00368D25F6
MNASRAAGLLHELADVAESRWPDRPAVSDADTTLTHAELAAYSRHLATALHALDLRKGDRMVVAVKTVGVLVPALVFAASRLGVVFCVLHEQVRGAPLAHVLDDCAPALVVSDDGGVLADAAVLGISAVTPDGLRTALASAGDGPGAQPPATVPLSVDPACLIYTSGSTALPKAVVATHAQAGFAVEAIHTVLGYRPHDVVHCALPLSFDYGLYQVFLGARSGAHVRLAATRATGPLLLRELLSGGATVLPAVPSIADALAWLLRRSSGPRPALRMVTNTGAAVSPATLAELRAGLPGVRIHVMFGLTECKRATIMPADGDLGRPGSCGLPLPGTEVVACGPDGSELPPGRPGELVVRGPHVMAGYWRRPAQTAARFPRRHGLFPELRTGDRGWVDADGYVYFAGRDDDLYKERGFRVSTLEVEEAARRVPGVDAALVLTPDGPHRACLLVVSTLARDEVLLRMREQIEPAKIPCHCTVVARLPLNANGKPDRRAAAALVRGAGGDS